METMHAGQYPRGEGGAALNGVSQMKTFFKNYEFANLTVRFALSCRGQGANPGTFVFRYFLLNLFCAASASPRGHKKLCRLGAIEFSLLSSQVNCTQVRTAHVGHNF
jgi:hypothetical protein